MHSVRVRFPPSPTGLFHIGNARTALFNYLYAKHHGGAFVVRFEDTDRQRSEKQYEGDILAGLMWLGLDADEGPEYGPNAPYRQSERTELYKKYLAKLLEDDKAFYCFHSEQELEEEAKFLLHEKRPIIHACGYRDHARADAEKMQPSKKNAVIRLKAPAGRTIAWRDLIRGDVSFASDLVGDFSIARNMDEPLYHFAVVVDDHEMKITHVIRGEDHIANTPKHILLAEALGFPLPEYAHLPLILGPDRSKLSKRHGATSVDEYRQQGYLPEALFNFMALVGWNPGGDREIFSKEELVREFSLEHVQKSGAIFDFQKLDWMNGEYIRRKSVAELTDLCLPFFGADTSEKDRAYLEKMIALEQPRLKKLSEIGERTDYFFQPPKYDKELLRWKEMSDEDIAVSLRRSESIISSLGNGVSKLDIERAFLDAIGEGDKGVLLWPLRVALSGKKASPGPFEIMEILGAEESRSRLRAAVRKLQ